MVGILAASIDSAAAASILVNTVGTVNGNGKTIINATGNSFTSTTFGSDIATAYANNIGGVWDFETIFSQVEVGETITFSYGTSLANSLVMTLGGDAINTGFIDTAEATSGTLGLGLSNSAMTRTFTLDTPLLSLGIFVGNRGDSGRTSVLTVTYLDNTTASTSGANAGPDAGSNYFHGLSGTEANPIVSFSLTQSNFVRYDDLGFIVASAIPEPSRALLVMFGMMGLLARRRVFPGFSPQKHR